MRKLSAPRGGGEKLGVLSLEVAALMSRTSGLWRALAPANLSHLRTDAIRLEGVRRLVSDDDAALLALALAEMASACRDLARAVARLSARCHDPLLRRFPALFSALVKNGAEGAGDAHGLRYGKDEKMDRKARKMQRLVANTACLCHELDVLAELEQQQKQRGRGKGKAAAAAAAAAECARRVARQRGEVERLRAASLWARTFDYAVRLLARSLFTVVAKVVEVFDLQPVALLVSASASLDDDASRASRLSMVYPSDVVITDAPRKTMLLRARSSTGTGKVTAAGDARRVFMSRSKSLRQQLRWPGAAGKHLIGCVVMGPSARSPGNTDGWVHAAADAGAHLPLSFSCVSSAGIAADADDFSITSFHSRTTAVFDPSARDLVTRPPASTLGGAALALHYANLVMFVERLAEAPLHICDDERDALYGMLTDRLRASLRARLRPPPPAAGGDGVNVDAVVAARWSDTVRRTLSWLAPLAHNTVRWQAERTFEQRSSVAAGYGGGDGGGGAVLLLQTLHFADRRKTEAAVTELLVGLHYVWRHGTELEAKLRLESESAVGRRRQLR